MKAPALAAAGVALVLACTGLAPATAEAHGSTVIVTGQHDLRDLQLATAGPLDDARASLVMIQYQSRTIAVLRVRGIDRSVAGRSFGAHLHVGPCVTGNGAAAGPHYNSDTAAGRVPPRVDATTEIWLDFEVTEAGTGFAMASVPFGPAPGNRAVVVHQEPTDPNGAAGPRLACLPVSW